MLEDRTWLLLGRRMANEASIQELKELEEILKINPELNFSLQTLCDLWQQSPEKNPHELEASYQSHLTRMKNLGGRIPGTNEDYFVENPTLFSQTAKKTRISGGMVAGIGFASMAAVLIAVVVMNDTPVKTVRNHNPPVTSEISTRYGSKTNIVLPDGSKVWLNSGSKLTYDKSFGENLREVNLTGEAYFDVVHNATRPFVIHTRAMDIKVLGTEFNVKSYPEESTTEASLIKGSIEVSLLDKRADKIILKPREKLIVSNETMPEPGNHQAGSKNLNSGPIFSLGHLNYFSLDSTILETSWVNNKLVFEDESFSEVASKMSRWYGVDFEFHDGIIKNERFTGNFKNESIEEALKAMQITTEFSFRIADKHVTITKH